MRTKPTTNNEEPAPPMLRAKAAAFKALNRRVDTRLSNNMDVARRVIAQKFVTLTRCGPHQSRCPS
jgi:hypothetical protein